LGTAVVVAMSIPRSEDAEETACPRDAAQNNASILMPDEWE